MAIKLPRIKLLGRDDDLLLILIGVGAIAFIATAVNAEMERRWKQAATGAAGAAGMLAALPVGNKKSFQKGYETFNPNLHVDQLIEAREAARDARGGGSGVVGTVGRGVMAGVAQAATSVAADHIKDRFSPRGPSAETLAAAPPKAPKLPLRPLLEKMTVQELRDYARDTGHGGGGLASARKSEIIDRLLKD